MSFQPVPYLFAASLALNLTSSSAIAQSSYDKAALEAAVSLAKSFEGVTKCNQMIDPGCHVPIPRTNGPDGCTDCTSSSLLQALKGDQHLYMPNSLEINGTRLELLKENTGSGTIFALPSQ